MPRRLLVLATTVIAFLGSTGIKLAAAQEPEPQKRATLEFDGGDEKVGKLPNDISRRDEAADAVAVAAPIRSLFSLRHDIGDGVGFRNGFTYLESFVPISQRPGQSITFSNMRIVNFDDKNLWEWNIGGGHRRLNRRETVVLGINAYYDGNRSYHNTYHQLGVGIEVLGPIVEFRANTYTVLGRRETQLGQTFADPFFIGHNIGLNRTDFVETALSGVDCEIGGPLPFLRRFDPRGFVGFYHYSGANTQNANGVRLRGEARLSDRVTAHLVAQNDGRFDTTVYGGLAIHFGEPRPRFRGQVEDKLGNRVVRDVNIVMGQDTRKSQELATDVNTGQPIVVNHVASFVANGGDGSVERPYNTLAGVQAGSKPNQIIFAHAGSLFTGDGIYLQNGQRFLGEGATHYFTAQQGTFQLPRATTNTALPKIYQTMDCAVHLANDTEVAGFVMEQIGCDAIHGEFVKNVLIRDNIIRQTSASGIFLFEVTGNVAIRNNVIDQAGLSGIEFVFSQGSANLLVENNRISNSFADQLVLATAMDANLNAVVRNNVFSSGIAGSDVYMLHIHDSRANVLIQNNTFTKTGAEAIFAETYNNANLRVQIKNNTIDGAGSDAIAIETYDSSKVAIQVAGNTIRGAAFSSVYAEAFDTSNLCMQILGNTVDRDMDLFFNAGAVFNLEGTSPLAPFLMGANTFQGGAVANVDPGVTPVPLGFCGFTWP